MRTQVSLLLALISLGLIGLLGGCSSPTLDDLRDGQEPPLRAYFDLREGVVPTPTDLVRTSEGLALPIEEDLSAAEKALRRYLNSLDGYPLGSQIEIPVSGQVDPQTLGGSLLLINVQEDRRIPVSIRFDQEKKVIHGAPQEELSPGTQYLVALIGYERGVQGLRGEPLIADGPFFLIRAERSLRNHTSAMPGATEEERVAQAEELAMLQDQFEPAFRALTRRGFSRDEVAVMAYFTTSHRPTLRFDPQNGLVPMPNDILIDPDSGALELPLERAETAEELRVLQALSQYDGFSTTAALEVISSADLLVEQTDGVFRLFRRHDDGDWEEVTDVKRGLLNSGRRYWMTPEVALEPGTEYIYLVSKELQSRSGQGHQADPLGAILLFDTPVFEEGQGSLVSSLDDQTAWRVEGLRSRVNQFLESQAEILREELALAVPFRTLSTLEPLLERRAELYRRDVSTRVHNLEITNPSGGARLLLNNVETIVRGEMTILDYIDPETNAFRESGEAEERLVRFVVTLPRNQSVVDPIPVVLFGHGLATSRELLYLIADPLAAAGFAGFSFDLPYHGDRTPCSRDDNCAGRARCDSRGECRFDDGSKGELIEASVPYLSALFAGTQYDQLLNYPIGSGEQFIDVHDVVATRDHFAQAYLDLQQAVRVIRGEDLAEKIADPGTSGLFFDGSNVVYLGMSLGGILGSGLTAIEPNLRDFVLNVPAADLTKVIEESVTFRGLYEAALEDRGLTRGDDGYFRFINALRWLLDAVDPVNLVHYRSQQGRAYEDPQTGEVLDIEKARIRIQMAEGDLVVPNVGTFALGARSGIEVGVFRPAITDHAFLFDPNPFAYESRTAREEMVDFFLNR